jgi:hypothetical protein
MALIEAIIDFGEDENIEDGILKQGKFFFSIENFFLCLLTFSYKQ